MKKLFLLLTFLLFEIVNAQISYDICDDNNDGFATFDLTSKNPEIITFLGLDLVNISNYTISFHESLIESQNGENQIANSANYTNLTNLIPFQELYVRVVNIQTSEVLLTTLNLNINLRPIANPASLFFCDPFELPVYNLNNSIPQIIANPSNFIITFHETLTEAQLNYNLINFAYHPLFSPIQILYVRVTNPQTGCYTTTSLTLNTNTCNTGCTPPTNLNVNNLTNTTVTLTWTPFGNINSTQYYITTYGSPAPTLNTLPTGSVPASVNVLNIASLFPDACYTAYVRTNCTAIGTFGAWSEPQSFCMYNCSNNAQCPESLELVAFVDLNNDGIKNSNEFNINYGSFQYEINNSGNQLYGNTNNGPFYIFDSNPSNSYNLNFNLNPELSPYYSTTTSYNNINIPSGSGSTTYYFPITLLQSFSDLEVQIIPVNNPRPGFTYTNTILYKNKGSQIMNSGTINFIKSPIVSILNVTQSGTTTNATGFSYDFTNLIPEEQRSFQVEMQVPTIPVVNIGNLLTNAVSITPLINDVFPLDNSSSLAQTVVGSYDPNDKSEAHGGKIIFADFTSTDYLTYTIRFENTGTANAEFIRIEDLLDSSLDSNSVVFLNSSHNLNMRRVNNKLIWNFYDINLPPTSINPNLSHGYIQFKIKPLPGFAIGSIIQNRADIYFDYNPAINTNIFQTEFVQNLTTTLFDEPNFIIYPNPAKNNVIISMQNLNEAIQNVTITDILGKTVKNIKNITSSELNVDVSDVSNGIYLVEITTNNNQKITKKLVIN